MFCAELVVLIRSSMKWDPVNRHIGIFQWVIVPSNVALLDMLDRNKVSACCRAVNGTGY